MNQNELKYALEQCLTQYNASNYRESGVWLRDIFMSLSKLSKIRDNWNIRCVEVYEGISIVATSEKTGQELNVGISDFRFYVESTLYEPKILKNMKPEFWSVLATLDLMKCFSFEENAGFQRNVDFDLRIAKSSVYALIRNYVLLEEHNENGSVDIGKFESSWDIEEPIDLVYQQVIESLQGIYKLNYLMYRLEYTRNRGKKKTATFGML